RRLPPQPGAAHCPGGARRPGRLDRRGADGRRPRQRRGHGAEVNGEDRQRYLDRELSWLDFNGRVLALAEDAKLPLLERVKFLAIFSRNLDEFFMIRAAATGGLGPQEELSSVRKRTEELVLRQTDVFRDDVQPRLAEEGIRLLDWG